METAKRRQRWVLGWLVACAALVLAMVAVGGVTRLTRSGLSIVEWQPVTGALPPLSQEAWARAYAAYQASPEGRTVHAHLDLAGFQRIYHVEWFHRLLGRLVGLAFLLPWLLFTLRGFVTRRHAVRLLVWFVLGGLQGALGWFMVKSGLVDEPRVSPYRLTAHLLLALARPAPTRSAGPAGRWARALLPVLVLALAWGGLMAGHRAGWVSDTFPKMMGQWVPVLVSGDESLWAALATSPVAVHFTHRVLGLAVLLLALGAAWHARREAGGARLAGGGVGALALAQVALGVLTVVSHVPLWLAVLHQVNGALLLGSAVGLVYFTALHAQAAGALSWAAGSARTVGLAGPQE